MKNIFFQLFLFAALLIFHNSQAKVRVRLVDDVKPLPQINKEFLVVAHIVLNANKVPGIDSLTIVKHLNEMNEIFMPISASFKLCAIDYIENFQYNSVDPNHSQEMQTKYRVKNRINLYYVSVLQNIDYTGTADIGGITSTEDVGIVLGKDFDFPPGRAHAFGHFFSLLHTNEGFGTELVNGSNCVSAGDLVCDTPADPYDFTSVPWLSNCLFINTTKKDRNNAYYEPDVSNLMGMYSANCKCMRFTNGQYTKMAEYYLKNPQNW